MQHKQTSSIRITAYRMQSRWILDLLLVNFNDRQNSFRYRRQYSLKVKHCSGCAHKYFHKNQSIMKKREVSLIRITFQFLISRGCRREHLERVTWSPVDEPNLSRAGRQSVCGDVRFLWFLMRFSRVCCIVCVVEITRFRIPGLPDVECVCELHSWTQS